MEITEVKLKEILTETLTEQRKEFERYVGVVAEDFKSQLQVVTEMVGQNTEDITIMKDDITIMKKNIHIMKQDIGTIKHDLKGKADKEDMKSLHKRVEILERR